ncbi:MAG: extracellular solute-binding protein [Pseudomonadota bacterium]
MQDEDNVVDIGLAAPNVRRARDRLRILGTSVTQTPPICQAAERDIGVEFEFITRDGTAAQRMGALQPNDFDVYDQWFQDIDLTWPTGSIQPIDLSRIDRWDEINALPKQGRLRPDVARPRGGDPSKRLFVQLDGSLGDTPSDRISMVPTVHNADSFAVTGADPKTLDSWGTLLDSRWRGRTILQSDAAIGTLDMLLALRAHGELRVSDIGGLTLEEIDQLTAKLRGYLQNGHFRCCWTDESEAIAAFSTSEPTIGSLWWSGLTELRANGIQARMTTPKEGYRGWFGGLSVSSQASGWKLDAAYDYLNWWLSGRAGALMARAGAYVANPYAVRPYLSETEWDFWYAGKPAADDIRDQAGRVIFDKGEVREGGDYETRMSRVIVWDTIMTEHNYLVRSWQSSLSQGPARRFQRV